MAWTDGVITGVGCGGLQARLCELGPPWSSRWGQTQSGGKGARSDKGRGAFGVEPLEGDLVAAPFGSNAWGRRWGKVPPSKSLEE